MGTHFTLFTNSFTILPILPIFHHFTHFPPFYPFSNHFTHFTHFTYFTILPIFTILEVAPKWVPIFSPLFHHFSPLFHHFLENVFSRPPSNAFIGLMVKWSKNDPRTHLSQNFNEIRVNLEDILIGFGEK
jgi:hypothetical protein